MTAPAEVDRPKALNPDRFPRLPMAVQKPQQLDTGISGSADDANADHGLLPQLTESKWMGDVNKVLKRWNSDDVAVGAPTPGDNMLI